MDHGKFLKMFDFGGESDENQEDYDDDDDVYDASDHGVCEIVYDALLKNELYY